MPHPDLSPEELTQFLEAALNTYTAHGNAVKLVSALMPLKVANNGLEAKEAEAYDAALDYLTASFKKATK